MLLIFYGIPLVLIADAEVQLLGGWNIALGLLIAGVVAANYRHAPLIALLLAVLLTVRLAIALFVLTWSVATLSDALLFVLGAAVAIDLRRQKRLSA